MTRTWAQCRSIIRFWVRQRTEKRLLIRALYPGYRLRARDRTDALPSRALRSAAVFCLRTNICAVRRACAGGFQSTDEAVRGCGVCMGGNRRGTNGDCERAVECVFSFEDRRRSITAVNLRRGLSRQGDASVVPTQCPNYRSYWDMWVKQSSAALQTTGRWPVVRARQCPRGRDAPPGETGRRGLVISALRRYAALGERDELLAPLAADLSTVSGLVFPVTHGVNERGETWASFWW